MIELRAETLNGKLIRYVKRIDGKNFKSSRGCTKREASAEFEQWYKKTFHAPKEPNIQQLDIAVATVKESLAVMGENFESIQCVLNVGTMLEAVANNPKFAPTGKVEKLVEEWLTTEMPKRTVANKIVTIRSMMKFFVDRFNSLEISDESWKSFVNDLHNQNKDHRDETVAAAGVWSGKYTNEVLKVTKQFLQWAKLHKRITAEDWTMVFKREGIRVAQPNPQDFTPEEFRQLLESAKGDLRIILLTMLNSSATQGDICSFTFEKNFDLKAGTLTRKRKKTKDEPGTPTVQYTLYPEIVEWLNAKPVKTGKVFVGWSQQTIYKAYQAIQPNPDKTLKVIRSTGATILAMSEFPSNKVETYLGNKNPVNTTNSYAKCTVLDAKYTQYIRTQLGF